MNKIKLANELRQIDKESRFERVEDQKVFNRAIDDISDNGIIGQFNKCMECGEQLFNDHDLDILIECAEDVDEFIFLILHVVEIENGIPTIDGSNEYADPHRHKKPGVHVQYVH